MVVTRPIEIVCFCVRRHSISLRHASLVLSFLVCLVFIVKLKHFTVFSSCNLKRRMQCYHGKTAWCCIAVV